MVSTVLTGVLPHLQSAAMDNLPFLHYLGGFLGPRGGGAVAVVI